MNYLQLAMKIYLKKPPRWLAVEVSDTKTSQGYLNRFKYYQAIEVDQRSIPPVPRPVATRATGSCLQSASN